MSDNQKSSRVLLGYVPLLDPRSVMQRPGEYVDTDTLFSLQIDSAIIEGVAWVSNQDEPHEVTPVFIMDNADAVRDHLEFWCEKDYSRFTLRAVQKESGYAIALVPDPNQSILRWKTARLAFHEEMVDDSEFIVFYRYLGVFCPGNRLQSLTERLGDHIMLGFVNTESHNDLAKISYLGPFKLVIGEDQHLSQLLPKEALEASP